MELQEKQLVVIYKAFCDENRIRILRLLQQGEMCACHLLDALEISQPTLSHHMKLLCDANIVTGRKEGKWIYYTLNPIGGQFAVEQLQSLLLSETE